MSLSVTERSPKSSIGSERTGVNSIVNGVPSGLSFFVPSSFTAVTVTLSTA